ncbi:RING-H2 finger protein ATL74 isoform X1 [Musa acuminata AAA Group]|uniref:RING-H2 finger protein ATL74 isoform X1 n=3 Tax=Musa acuminata AAA Group TaxID=214697 RepID=UPI0031D02C22
MTESAMRRLLGEFLGMPPAAANGTRQHATGNNGGGSGGTASFDTNMVFILAALLCALVFALGLNSVVRCALRCGRRVVFENPEEVSSRLAATGLKKRSLRRIPVAVYGSGADFPATECPICLGEFADGEKVRVLPRCHHGFHVRCIDKWLASHSSCPTCRQSLLDHGGGDGFGGHVMESPHP